MAGRLARPTGLSDGFGSCSRDADHFSWEPAGLVVTDPAEKRAYQRRWRAANPERMRAYAEARRVAPTPLVCVECGTGFVGRKGRLLCSRRCKDRRYARLHPDKLRDKKRRKAERSATK